jgi:3-(3-hydroxy-phenyl)propionate hydroxylase
MTALPVLIVGAGPTGMTAALELAFFGISSVLLDDDHILSEGSRAIAYSADTLAVWEKLGAAQAMLAKGVAWSIRHTYFRDRELYIQNFSQPEAGYLPRFFNLPQHDVEQFLLERIQQSPLIKLCWDHLVTGCHEEADRIVLQASTPSGVEEFSGCYVLACDGARSGMRKLLNLPFEGVTHRDHFLIADIRVDLKSPPEPRFYFDHPTNRGQTILIHPQPEGIWRFDWQVGPEVDIQQEREPGRMDRRIRALIGDLPYEIVWLSDYRFHQRLLDRFRHGRIFFLGDAAHLVAPFGARGMNSAVADVENLAWKITSVIKYGAPDFLLDTYQLERWPAQQHNQAVTNTTMLFMSPPNRWRRALRNLILRVSPFYLPARRWVNSGKMVEPYDYKNSPLIERDDLSAHEWSGAPPLGSKVQDMKLIYCAGDEQLPIFLRKLVGAGFVILYFSDHIFDEAILSGTTCDQLPGMPVTFLPILSARTDHNYKNPYLIDESGSARTKFAARSGTFFLIRPDGHIAARRRRFQPAELTKMVCNACGIG